MAWRHYGHTIIYSFDLDALVSRKGALLQPIFAHALSRLLLILTLILASTSTSTATSTLCLKQAFHWLWFY